MLETVDFSREPLTKEEYKPQKDALMKELVVLQQQARERNLGLVVLFEGWDGAGKGSRISDLMYNLDARATTVHVTENFDAKAMKKFAGTKYGVTGYYPAMQEFWNALGMRGTITFYDRGWYTVAMQRMLYEQFGTKLDKREPKEADAEVKALRHHLASVGDFEKQLVDDGYLVVKFFIHITKESQTARLTKLHDDPATRWRVSDEKLARIGNYEEAYHLYDNLLEGSDFSYAPWHVLNGEDKRSCNLHIAETLVKVLREALEEKPDEAAAAAAAKAQANSAGKLSSISLFDRTPEEEEAIHAQSLIEAQEASRRAPHASRFRLLSDAPTVDSIDNSLSLEVEEYREQLKKEQKRFAKLELEMYRKRVPLILMFEGWDAAGKGGAIKRIAQAIDARAYTIFPSPAPTKPELLHPHLWRYWTRLPRAGHVGIYDRSWYGRVLVERVEGFASPAEWGRAYDEINEFERDLVNWGALLLKFWVNVSQDEQLARFTDRQNDPSKQWKITDEDWRNRDKYPQYKAAVDDMFRLTHTPFAPWTVLESDSKLHARVKALKTINEALEARLSK